MFYSAILLAAGKGTRYHGRKQDVMFRGKPLWHYAYETAASVVGKGRIIAVGKDIPGGVTRTGSVMNGLKALPEDGLLIPKIKLETGMINPKLPDDVFKKVIVTAIN